MTSLIPRLKRVYPGSWSTSEERYQQAGRVDIKSSALSKNELQYRREWAQYRLRSSQSLSFHFFMSIHSIIDSHDVVNNIDSHDEVHTVIYYRRPTCLCWVISRLRFLRFTTLVVVVLRLLHSMSVSTSPVTGPRCPLSTILDSLLAS